MKLITNRISTGKPKRFEDFVAGVTKKEQIKTASVKVAEEKEEADSSGQLDVEPLHQEGESTTMPKNGPSAKKKSEEGVSTGKVAEEKNEADSSGQPEWEGKKENNNDPEEPTEKGGSSEKKTKEAGIKGNCAECGKPNFLCKCEKGECAEGEDKEEKEEDKEASSKVEFVKIANLDDKNKSFLKEYWRQLFGDDYVNALIADK